MKHISCHKHLLNRYSSFKCLKIVIPKRPVHEQRFTGISYPTSKDLALNIKLFDLLTSFHNILHVPCMIWQILENWILRPPVKYFTDRSKAVLLLWIFMFLFCLVFAMSLCASVYICFVVTFWEKADLLALVCGVYCEFVTFPLVSWVRCDT